MPTHAFVSKRIRMIGFCFLAALAAYPQTASNQAAAPPARTGHGLSLRQPPCWQQVGIAKAAIEQRRAIEKSTRAQVDSVCGDSTLNAQQKHQRIRQLRQQARQRIDAIITPQQQQALKACNTQRAGNRQMPPRRPAEGGLGPCAESASSPSSSEGEPSADTAKQP